MTILSSHRSPKNQALVTPLAEGPRIIAVGGGKGGVGKTVVSVNLAVAMAQTGHRVVLVDGDLGAANAHILVGMTRPNPTMANFIRREVDCLDAVALQTPVPNLRLVAGSWPVPGVANIGHTQKLRLLRHIRLLETDVVVIDVGAGSSYNVLDLLDVADLRLVVLTSQLTSLTNAYGFLKSAVYRVLLRIARRAGKSHLMPTPDQTVRIDRIEQLLQNITAQDALLGTQLRMATANFGARLIVNQTRGQRDLKAGQTVAQMARNFLSLDAPLLGTLTSHPEVSDSIDRRRPYLLSSESGAGNVLSFRRMAQALLDADIDNLRSGRQRLAIKKVTQQVSWGASKLPAAPPTLPAIPPPLPRRLVTSASS